MHITILALGSRGDVQPIVTLGKALTAPGHRVRVATFDTFRPLITEAGLEFSLIRGDFQAFRYRLGAQPTPLLSLWWRPSGAPARPLGHSGNDAPRSNGISPPNWLPAWPFQHSRV